jgi:hypothetical protein
VTRPSWSTRPIPVRRWAGDASARGGSDTRLGGRGPATSCVLEVEPARAALPEPGADHDGGGGRGRLRRHGSRGTRALARPARRRHQAGQGASRVVPRPGGEEEAQRSTSGRDSACCAAGTAIRSASSVGAASSPTRSAPPSTSSPTLSATRSFPRQQLQARRSSNRTTDPRADRHCGILRVVCLAVR